MSKPQNTFDGPSASPPGVGEPGGVRRRTARADPVRARPHRRHRRSLLHRATPGTVYTSLPKADWNGDRRTDTHDRVRHDKIDKAGSVTLLVQDLHVTVIHAATGQILRDLIIDPRRDYQPTGRPPGPRRQ